MHRLSLAILALVLAGSIALIAAPKQVPGNFKVILPDGPSAVALPQLPRKAGLASIMIIIPTTQLVYDDVTGKGSYLATEPVADVKQRFGYLGTAAKSERGVSLTIFDAKGQRPLIATGFVSVNEVNDAGADGIVPRTKVIAIVLQGFIEPTAAGALPRTMRARLSPHGIEFLLRRVDS